MNLAPYINRAALVSELTHFFCCGLPLVISLASFLSSIGMTVSLPGALHHVHELMHGYETIIILGTSFLLVLATCLHMVSTRLECRSTGCHHPPCTPQKRKSAKLLYLSYFFYVLNLTLYIAFHAG